jgi:hypothetical protein
MALRLAVLALALLAAGAHASCQGNGCEEQTKAGRAAGLLGGSLGTCTPKTYPASGALSPVSGSADSTLAAARSPLRFHSLSAIFLFSVGCRLLLTTT